MTKRNPIISLFPACFLVVLPPQLIPQSRVHSAVSPRLSGRRDVRKFTVSTRRGLVALTGEGQIVNLWNSEAESIDALYLVNASKKMTPNFLYCSLVKAYPLDSF